MPNALEYFLGADRDVVHLELIEVSHSSFTQVYRRVRNAVDGVTVTLEDGVTQAHFEHYPLKITPLGDQGDLDVGIRIDFGDLGTVLPKELDAVMLADEMITKPSLVYRSYRSDDLTSPLIGPLELSITSISFKKEGASFEARAPYLNKTKTGESYNLTRFPMLWGFIK